MNPLFLNNSIVSAQTPDHQPQSWYLQPKYIYICIYSPPQVERIWGTWGSYYSIPNAIFYLLKGDYKWLTIRVIISPLNPVARITLNLYSGLPSAAWQARQDMEPRKEATKKLRTMRFAEAHAGSSMNIGGFEN